MREVIVETVGKGACTIKVGIDLNKIKKRKERRHITGLICSPGILPHTGSDRVTLKSRSWKTTKRGQSHASKNWQRHPFGPYCRRKKYGKLRGHSYPSVRILNELGRYTVHDV
jgi:hypothetical protein